MKNISRPLPRTTAAAAKHEYGVMQNLDMDMRFWNMEKTEAMIIKGVILARTLVYKDVIQISMLFFWSIYMSRIIMQLGSKSQEIV